VNAQDATGLLAGPASATRAKGGIGGELADGGRHAVENRGRRAAGRRGEAGADAERQAALGQLVERARIHGDLRRMAQEGVPDADAERDPAGGCGVGNHAEAKPWVSAVTAGSTQRCGARPPCSRMPSHRRRQRDDLDHCQRANPKSGRRIGKTLGGESA
jgi:hypothetical protein